MAACAAQLDSTDNNSAFALLDRSNIQNEQLRNVLEEWEELQKEYKDLKETHKKYMTKVKDVKDAQRNCMNGIAHQRYRMKQILDGAKQKVGKDNPEDKNILAELNKDMQTRKNEFRELEDVLPHQNGIYLSIILGSVNVSLLSKEDKFKYKQDYERFKLIVTGISFVISFCLLTVLQYSTQKLTRDPVVPGYYCSPPLVYDVYPGQVYMRWIDAAFHFLLVWYYCTLTIREHILKVNGSRIKGWWVVHHFISTAAAGILLIWPESVSYHSFRKQFTVFTLYLSIVQVVQYYYQSGCLYRLRSLGARHSMDITVEGFQSWMWKGLVFVLPFLFAGYSFQLYNAWTLYQLSFHHETHEWQVPVLCFFHFVLFFGNTWATLAVVRQKFKHKLDKYFYRNKYRFDASNSKVL